MIRYTEKDKAAFEEHKQKNAINFSNYVAQQMGLDILSDGTLYYDDILFNFDGFKYIPYTMENVQKAEENEDTIKVFDPYSNLKLMEFCLRFYLATEINIPEDRILVLGVTNNKMNDKGACFVKFYKHEPGVVYDENTSLNTNGTVITGHIYSRDCLKYADMMLMFSGALPFEYDELRKMELTPYEKFVLEHRAKTKRVYELSRRKAKRKEANENDSVN